MDLVFAPSRIETWPIARLRLYARNARTHDADQVAKIAASMAEFGWTVPCLVADDGELIAGHGRVLAAMQLGLTEVPVIRLSHLDDAERRAYRIADNKLTELGTWDEALLLEELRGLMAEDFDLGVSGSPRTSWTRSCTLPTTARPSTMTRPTPSPRPRPIRSLAPATSGGSGITG
jgi:hypothetical protein